MAMGYMVKREARGTYWMIYIVSCGDLTVIAVCFLNKFANFNHSY